MESPENPGRFTVILLDIDDTLVDHSGAELRVAFRFGRVHADRIPTFSEA